jgi:DNA-binding transcriptional regulator YiaG
MRAEIGGLRKSSANYRREIAALKRQIAGLGKDVASASKGSKKPVAEAAPKADPKSRHRFQAKGLIALRSRLGISRESFARLAGVSALSIYNWEHGKATPRAAQLLALAKVRGMGKREAEAALARAK